MQVPYTYYICTVKLENFNLSHVPVYIMSQDQLSLYAMYMATLGNRPDLVAEQFESVASQLAAEYWRDHSRDILGIVADSYLEEYDDYNIEVAFKNAAAVSITYSLMSRCGMQPEDHFEHEDFFSIFDFNTPRTVAALGTAVSEINEQVLRQIEVTIRNYEREHSAERTAEHAHSSGLACPWRFPAWGSLSSR